MDYLYLGDRHTDDSFRRIVCSAVRKNKKCIRGKNGNMLVQLEDGHKVVIVGRLLRKLKAFNQ